MKAYEQTMSVRRFLASPYLVTVSRLVLGITFFAASLDKIAHSAAFAKDVANYRFLPYEIVSIFAVIIPWIELCSGLLLILGLFTRGSTLIISLMLIAFIVAIFTALVRGIDIACGCFSTTDGHTIGVELILRDLLLLILAIHIFFSQGSFASISSLFAKKRWAQKIE